LWGGPINELVVVKKRLAMGGMGERGGANKPTSVRPQAEEKKRSVWKQMRKKRTS